MIRHEGEQWLVDGPVTIESHVKLRDAARELGALPAQIDWSGATEVDSSALSLLFAWQREGQAATHQIRSINLPQNLQDLANLYGVQDLINS